MDWEAIAREVETGERTPAQVAKSFGFRGWTQMMREAPEEVRPRLRQALIRNQKVRAMAGSSKRKPEKPEGSEEAKELEKGAEPEKEEIRAHEEVAKVRVRADESRKEDIEPEEKGKKAAEEKKIPWTWVLLMAAALVLVYAMWRRRALEERGRRFVQRAFEEENRRPPTDWRREYGV